jgi:hypothetical protein
MHRTMRVLASGLISCALVSAGVSFLTGVAAASPGSIIFTDAPGTSAPPPTLGSYHMTPFPADSQPEGTDETSVQGPTGALGFAPALEHCLVGGCWATWSNGYSGDVYATEGTSLTMTLPAATKAFYFYAEPDQFQTFDITATSSDGTTSGAVPVAGEGGAEYFGFYATGTATISSITVTGTDPTGLAVGEFGISNGTEHVVVNSEAWIPFAQVADPLFPTPLPYSVTAFTLFQRLEPNCFTPPAGQQSSTLVNSTYGGDAHTAFGAGTYRMRTEVSFDFNPSTDTITNFTQDSVPAIGTSHRTKVYTSGRTVIGTCTQAATGTNAQVARLTSGTTFTLGYSGKNPLSRPAALTPPLHATIQGSMTADGGLTLSYRTTDFPSQGIQVSINGTPVSTDTENDVSCIGQPGVLGAGGAILLATGLNRTESGSETVEPTDNSVTATNSPLC